MNYSNLLFFISILFLETHINYTCAITYKPVLNRFGDCILNYVQSKYFSHKYSLLFYYREFLYSDLLTMHIQEKKFTPEIEQSVHDTILIHDANSIKKRNRSDLLFVSHFYSKTEDIYQYAVENPSFDAEIKKMLCPIIKPIVTIAPDVISIAVHIRKGGGFDKPLASEQLYTIHYEQFDTSRLDTIPRRSRTYSDYCWPKKFPPEQYYVDQLRLLATIWEGQQLYVYIFTDEIDTYSLVERIKQAVDKEHIQFDFRRTDNHHTLNIVEDFYAMSRFDCLIRSDSSYAKAAELLGNHSVIIYPKETGWLDNRLIIHTVEAKVPNRIDKTIKIIPCSINDEFITTLKQLCFVKKKCKIKKMTPL